MKLTKIFSLVILTSILSAQNTLASGLTFLPSMTIVTPTQTTFVGWDKTIDELKDYCKYGDIWMFIIFPPACGVHDMAEIKGIAEKSILGDTLNNAEAAKLENMVSAFEEQAKILELKNITRDEIIAEIAQAKKKSQP